jgi:protocatechuate 3,4-dioxygenase beta subunit
MATHDDTEVHDHDRGLGFDLATLMNRRRALQFVTGAGVFAFLAACGSKSVTGSGSTAATTSASTTASSGSTATSSATTAAGTATTAATGPPLTVIPEETAGPFPGDGTNGVNVLTESGIVRSDIRTSFGDASGTAAGVPINIDLTVLDSATGGALNGAAVYVWHCDQEGRYSMYTQGAADQNYLRGVQEADSSGRVEFTSIFPAAYSGRWPHIHFEIYASLSEATSAGSPITTSQLALPQDTCETVYATDGYRASVRNLSQTSLDTDMVFRDGYSQQLATVTGSVDDGYTVALNVPV